MRSLLFSGRRVLVNRINRGKVGVALRSQNAVIFVIKYEKWPPGQQRPNEQEKNSPAELKTQNEGKKW